MERLCFPVFPPHGTGRSTGSVTGAKNPTRCHSRRDAEVFGHASYRSNITILGCVAELQNLRSGAVICSDCFRDDGLRYEASLLGGQNEKTCPNYRSRQGSELTKFDAEALSPPHLSQVGR